MEPAGLARGGSRALRHDSYLVVSVTIPRYHLRRMTTALLLIFAPAATWERIFRARRGPVFIVLTYVLPLVAVTSLVEGYGLHNWGKWQSEVIRLNKLTVGEAVVFEVAQA